MTQQRLQIGEWRADPATNELHRADETVRVEPKVMEVLMALAARAGEVVKREELLTAVWPGVIVGDDALTQSIIKLRKALSDNPRSPSYIETISKRGYRLIAPLGKSDGVPEVHGADLTAPRPSSTFARRRIRVLGVTASIVLVLVAAGVYFFNSLSTRPTAVPASGHAFDAPEAGEAALLTVAVLPFETVGADAKQSHLAQGISSDLMTDLSRLPGLRLISASGDTAYGSTATALYVVSGTVQREGDTLRINVWLTDSRTKEVFWSQRFERSFGDIFVIQNEISRGVLQELPRKITDAEHRQLVKRYTSSPEAYEYFLRAKELFLVRRPEENDRARALYMKAIDLDPQFARAYAGLAMTYALEHRYQHSAGSSATLVRALKLAETARQIDPDIPEVNWALGLIHAQGRRYDQAIQYLKNAIELNRSYADAYALMGGIYTYIGQAERSVPLLRTALRLNPDGGYLYFTLLGRAYLFVNDTEQALINLQEARGRNPDDVETRIYLAAALVANGDRSAAEWEAAGIRALDAGFSMRKWLETYPLTSAAYRERLLELTAKVGLQV